MKKHIHIVGICGVTMAPLAVLYKKMGWKVTGSDRAFFPPMSTYLEKNGIKIMAGFKKEHVRRGLDLVLVNAFITEKNPEIVEAKRKKIPVKVYADVLPELIERENSVVIAGDCGKTSTAALAVWILEKAGYNPNFMVGGIPLNFEHGIRRTSSKWSIMEGDEYPASSWDNAPRFFYYNPKYLILTDVRWDHMDKFTTEKQYINIFKKLVAKIPSTGVIIANREGENVKQVVKKAKAEVVFYDSASFRNFPAPFRGYIWRQNSAAVIALARCLGIKDAVTRGALKTFLGIRRRQEVRGRFKNAVVIDDNAHTPVKVAGGLEAISKMFPGYSLCVIYEPGNRSAAALKMDGYKECFRRAETVILPHVTSASEEIRDFSKRLARKLKQYYRNCYYVEEDEGVISQIQQMVEGARINKKRIAFIFMSQKGFRGMIEGVISLLQ
ncbi:MAG: Mur ligase domain-containing protein [Candidatus Spechtbacterales bacterium]